MPCYEINFLKTVCGDRGEERTICQRTVRVDSRSEVEAIEEAKVLFCSKESVSHWSLRADSYEVHCGGEPSFRTGPEPLNGRRLTRQWH